MAHQKLNYRNNKNLDKLLKILIGFKLDKNLLKSRFCELYTKGKQYKTYNKEPPSHQAKKPGEK